MQFDIDLWKIDTIWLFSLDFLKQIKDFSSKLKLLLGMLLFLC